MNGAAGGVGHLVLQLLRERRRSEVVAVASTANLDFVRGLGVAEVVDHTREDVVRRGGRYDAVLDLVPNRSFPVCRPLLTREGVYVTTLPAVRSSGPFQPPPCAPRTDSTVPDPHASPEPARPARGCRARRRGRSASPLAGAGLVVQHAGLALHTRFNHNDLCHVLLIAALWPFYRAGRAMGEQPGAASQAGFKPA